MAKIDKVQEVAVTLLKPYEKNAKIHGREQLDKLKASIEEFGFLTPCLIDSDYNIIAGHGRVAAASEMGLKSVPCVFIEGLTDAQRKAYILADNRLGELGEWDMDIVYDELFDLDSMDFDITLTGFEMPKGDSEPSTESSFNYSEQYGVIVMCENEADQEKVYNHLTEEGYACKVVAV